MENTCPNGHPIKTIPAGVSRTTGKPYNAFQVCSDRNCNWKPQRPAIAQKSQVIAEAQQRKANFIEQAQDRKEESIARFSALNASINLMCHHPAYKNMLNEEQILEKIFALQLRFFNHNRKPLEYDVDVSDAPLPEPDY